ncbi:hypothetical protein TrVFT333_001057 [Trichoderma virens FT-333]|nr:hypothetical protein TrVFT333_001057 [Trichoderma virens FT-333]
MDNQVLDFIPSEVANEMQLRTRRHQNFDKIEKQLVNPKTSTPYQFSVSNVLNEISTWNPFAKAIVKGDVVWLFDNTAFKAAEHEPWQAEFIMAVFEAEPKCTVADIVAGIASAVGLADDAEERKTIEERLLPFLWDIQAARTTTVSQGASFTTKKTTLNIEGVEGVLSMETHFAAPEGWGIISDIDDTIKITTTSDPIGILKETFINPPSPVPGMPELYAGIKSFLPHNTPWFYLSASPYNLYPFLKGFRDTYYPPGTFILRDSSWKTVSGLLSSLTMGTEEYKVDRMKKINSWLPKRKLIVFGDSTQSDPEAYGEIYRKFPGWIRMIFIRKDTDSAAFGLAEKNEPQRFEKAFTGIPRDAWHVFENPDECLDLVKNAVKRNS